MSLLINPIAATILFSIVESLNLRFGKFAECIKDQHCLANLILVLLWENSFEILFSLSFLFSQFYMPLKVAIKAKDENVLNTFSGSHKIQIHTNSYNHFAQLTNAARRIG
jgi:hypothetical protein